MILAFLALCVLSTGTTCGADTSTGNFSQITLMEEFQIEEWGSFWAADFQGDRVFAAYTEDSFFCQESRICDLTKDNHLSHVLINDDKDRTLTTGIPLKLADGYEMAIQCIDLDGNKGFVQLIKDGNVIDSATIEPSKCGATIADKTYTYSCDVGDSQKIVTIAVQFKSFFRGAETDLATVNGIWQISETPIDIENGEVQVPQWRNFKLEEWGHFWAIESLGVVHFASYAEDSSLYGSSKDPDLTKRIQLYRVLIDNVEDLALVTSTPLQLEEGYKLAIQAIDLDGNKVYVELLKDETVVHAAVINAGTPGAAVEDKTYTYTRHLGGGEDVSVIAVHFKSSFRGADRDVAIVDGIWQISETPKNV